MNWKKSFGAVFFGVCLGFFGSQTESQEENFSYKKLLMPGKVIQGHAEFENECGKCHGTFKNVSQTTLCLDCHEAVKKDIDMVSGYHGRLTGITKSNLKQGQCKDCHSEHIGRKGDIVKLDKDGFNHQQTDFELIGKHIGVQCSFCHETGKKFREAPGQCFDCHESDDRHQGAFDTQCQNCHSSKGWKFSKFNHDDTDFALIGKHQQTQCNACHPDERYKNTPKQCNTCHVLNDVHNGVNGDQCNQCHRETGWKKIIFNHDKDTRFKLTGGHAKQRCDSCHGNAGFDDKPSMVCVDCHKNDDEHNGRNGAQCDSCHTTQRWKTVSFNHARDTEFALRGRHAKLTCESCHRDRTGQGKLSSVCVDCHRIDDVHKGQLGRQCDQCHNSNSWRANVRFNHDLTVFPLVGMHAVTSCDACHSSKTFHDAPNQCIDCHNDNDPHKRTLGPRCGDCHNPNGWNLWLFDHDAQTKFALDGAHQGLSCAECHTKPTGNRVKQSTACVACHLRDDVHNRRFGRACERCHTTDSFRDIRMQ